VDSIQIYRANYALKGGEIVSKDVVVEQEDIEVNGNKFIITRIPTATSGSWFVVHDACEIWAAVAIDDFSGEVVGWRNPPDEPWRSEMERAVKAVFGLLAPL
jgi:hypothetical protein